jgi:hypothetical protein
VARKQKSSATTKTTVVRSIRKSKPVRPVVDEVTTTTQMRTRPKVEVRRAATLAQALTEPAVRVVKPQTEIVTRKVTHKRRAA